MAFSADQIERVGRDEGARVGERTLVSCGAGDHRAAMQYKDLYPRM
jgi:hypothetical protein